MLAYVTLAPFSLSSPVVFAAILGIVHGNWAFGQFCAGVSAGVALASLPACCWRHCQNCAVAVAGIVPALLPLLHGLLCSCCFGVIDCGSPALPPALQRVSAQSQHSCNMPGYMMSLPFLLSLPLALLPYLASFHGDRLSMVWLMQRWSLCRHCTGILNTSGWCHCWHCAVVVAGIAPASLPSSRRHLCPCCTGVVALAAPALPPAF
jgi:hypothetical protein